MTRKCYTSCVAVSDVLERVDFHHNDRLLRRVLINYAYIPEQKSARVRTGQVCDQRCRGRS
jgi:hypothetical protein